MLDMQLGMQNAYFSSSALSQFVQCHSLEYSSLRAAVICWLPALVMFQPHSQLSLAPGSEQALLEPCHNQGQSLIVANAAM